MSLGGSKSETGSSSGSQVAQIDPDFKNAWLTTNALAVDTANAHQPQQSVEGFTGAGRQGQQMTIDAASMGLPQLSQAAEKALSLTGEHDIAVDPALAGVTGLAPPDAGLFSYRDLIAPQVAGPSASASLIDRGGIRDVGAPTFSGAGLQPFLDPYEDLVVDRTMADIDTQRRRAINGNSSNFSVGGGEGAWKGSRAGVADFLTNEGFAKQSADTAAALRSQGFSQASSLFGDDAARRMAAGQSNQGVDATVAGANAGALSGMSQFNATAGLDALKSNQSAGLVTQQANQGADLAKSQAIYGGARDTGVFNAGEVNRNAEANAQRIQAARLAEQGFNQDDISRSLQATELLSRIAPQLQSMGLTGASAVRDVGREQQDLLQQILDKQYENQYNQWLQPLQIRESAFGIMPSMSQGGNTISNTRSSATVKQNPGLLGIAGTGLQAASLFGLSDRRLKTAARELGERNGRRWHAFRYLWDHPSVTRIGLMAQENPDIAAEHDSGFLMVDYGKVAA